MNLTPHLGKPAASTGDIKRLLAAIFPDLHLADWKRTAKWKAGLTVERDFLHSPGACRITVVTMDDKLINVRLSVDGNSTTTMKDLLIAAAKPIKHCGDYGQLWWHAATGHVWLTLGDADGDPNGPGTPFDEVRRMLGAVTGVKGISIEAEADPDEADGWENFGQIGEALSWEELVKGWK